jgi:hypothetical protein
MFILIGLCLLVASRGFRLAHSPWAIGVGIDIFELMEKKIKELSEELRKRYGDDINKLMKDLS